MNGNKRRRRNWLTFLVSVLAISLVAVLGVLIWNTQAATPELPVGDAFVQLNPMAGEPGTIVTIGGRGWQSGETVLVYLVEPDSGSTDGVTYGSAVADPAGQIATSIRFPLAGPWTSMQEVLVSAKGTTSGRGALAAFQVIKPTAVPTAEPNTPTPQASNTPEPQASNTPEPPPPPESARTAVTQGHAWSPQEDEELRDGVELGLTADELAESMELPRDIVQARLDGLGLEAGRGPTLTFE